MLGATLRSLRVDEKLIIALVAAVSAVIGGLISTVLGPVIKHRLEQAASDKNRRREQIQKWRDMVLQLDRESGGDIDVGPALQAHGDFLTLEPYLSEEARRSVYARNMTILVGSTLAAQLRNMTSEIARIEKDWGLR